MVVSVDRRAPGADEVDQFAAVGRGERRAARAPHEKRRPTHGAERADRGVDAPRHEPEGTGKSWSEAGCGTEKVGAWALMARTDIRAAEFGESQSGWAGVAKAGVIQGGLLIKCLNFCRGS